MMRSTILPGLLALSALLPLVASSTPAARGETVRVATFNVALYGTRAGEVLERLEAGDDPQACRLAEIIQRVRPEVLLLNEIDYDADGKLLALFCDKYLAVGRNASNSPDGPADGIEFPHRYAAPSNTGVHSAIDLDGNGQVSATPGDPAYAGDCWGYGVYPGQYAFAILSQHPIDDAAVRTFQKLLWKDMPGAGLPDNSDTPEPADWYSAEALAQFRLSSKNHCDVPVVIRGRRIHLLASHPTPPVYDGAEDRNGRRNHDELRLWLDYIAESPATYLIDDNGEPGALATGASFILLGDLNGDPHDGEGADGIKQLLASPRVLQYPAPTSPGGAEQATLQGGANDRHQGHPAADTCDPADDPGPGNLRVDYILPSSDLSVAASGVFWPAASDPLFALTAGAAHPASSDHRLVWIDVELDGEPP